MSKNLITILSFIAVFIFLLIAGFNSYKYWNKQDKVLALEETEIKNNHIIDSLKIKTFQDSITVANLLTAKETEKVSRNNYAENKNKRDKEIYSNPVDINRVYNDKFILDFRPKY